VNTEIQKLDADLTAKIGKVASDLTT